MTDLQDLKNIAERCKGHQPLRFMRSHGALYIRNDKGIVFDVHQNRSFPEFMAENKDYADLVLAANPAAVLELIAQTEEDAMHTRVFGEVMRSQAEQIEQIKAENEALVNALNDILRVTPMGVEAFGIAALVLGELGVIKEASHG